jgi:hypothetical protein
MNATMPDPCAWMRLWRLPRRAFKGGTPERLSARGRYLLGRSCERFERRARAIREARVLTMEIGHVESIRFVLSPLIEVTTTPVGE